MEPRLVLASASPRRAAILGKLGVPFRVAVSSAAEDLLPGEDAETASVRLARAKAEVVAAVETLPVLAADTLVVCDGRILGKPATADEAAAMLRLLSGRSHDVVTGVCLLSGGQARTGLERTAVEFDPLSNGQVEAYVRSGEPMGKAGAYHVEGAGSVFIRRIDGSPSNVAGLPVRLVFRLAREAGVDLGLPG